MKSEILDTSDYIHCKMAVPKTCNVCGVTFYSKANLNRHMKRLHPSAKKTIYQKTTNQAKVKLKRKTTHSSMKVKVLNNVLWDLILKLIDHKNLADIIR